MNTQSNVCIIGAGVAGGALAAYLAKNGMRVSVIERNLSEQDRIVGELLQPGGVEQLRFMGLDHLIGGIDAAPVKGYALFKQDQHFNVNYPVETGKEITGYGFRNGKFVQNIRAEILQSPNVKVIKGRALDLVEENGRVTGVQYEDEEGAVHTEKALLTIACDGSASRFREKISHNKNKINGYFVGLVLKDAELPYAGHGHVIVAEPAPVLVYPISSRETRVLIDFPGEQAPRKGPEFKEYLLNQVMPQMPAQIQPSFRAAVEEGDIKMMPNCYMPANPRRQSGAVLLGDSLNMRHPLTGGGMTVAFTDVHRLGQHLLACKTADVQAYDEAVERFYAARHTNTATINILADALYGVIRNPELSEACFTYLKKGGKFAEEPVAILSAVSRNFKLLMRHFFAVAIHGVRTSKQFSFKRSYTMIGDAVRIVHPLVMSEKPDPFTKMALQLAKRMF